MKITFDHVKDAANIKKHGGLSLALALNFEWDTASLFSDSRFHYDEPRMIGVGYIGMHIYYMVYVDLGDSVRVISLRRAVKKEMKHYAEA